MNSIYTRRSVRKFTEQPVERKKLEQVIRAAMQAPSAANQQPWEFIVITDKAVLMELAPYNQFAKCLKRSQVAIVLLGNTQRMSYPDQWQQDLGAAMQNMHLEAVEQGLGSVWLGCAPDLERMDYVKNMLKLGDHLLPYSILALGYPLEENANHFVDRFDPTRITYIGE